MALLSFGAGSEGHLRDLSTPKVRDDIIQYGGKAGILEYLRRDPEFAPHILPGFYVPPDRLHSGNVPDLPEKFRRCGESGLIYRSTDPSDTFAYVGILPTIFNDERPPEPEPDEEADRIRSEREARKLTLTIAANCAKRGVRVRNDGLWIPDFIDPAGVLEIIDRINAGQATVDEIERQAQECSAEQKSEKPPVRDFFGDLHVHTMNRIREEILQITEDRLPGYLARRNLRNPLNTTGIYVQPKLSGGHVGSVLEHPNRPGTYVVSYRLAGENLHDGALFTDFVGENGSYQGGYLGHHYIPEDEVQPYVLQAVELYKKCKRKGVFEEGLSSQMEFGTTMDGMVYIYQLRQFRPFQLGSWKLDDGSKGLFFGITGPEGTKVILSVRDAILHLLHDSTSFRLHPPTTNGLLALGLKREIHPNVPIEDLDFFGHGGISRPSLLYPKNHSSRIGAILTGNFDVPGIGEHDNMRFIQYVLQKGGVVFSGTDGAGSELPFNGERLKITNNDGVIEVESLEDPGGLTYY